MEMMDQGLERVQTIDRKDGNHGQKPLGKGVDSWMDSQAGVAAVCMCKGVWVCM